MSAYSMLNALMTPGLTPNESRVYVYIVGRANGAKVTWPSIDEIAGHLGIAGRATVTKATGRLQALGLIRVQRRYRDSNTYHVLDVPGLHDAPFPPAPAADDWQPAWAVEVQKPTVQKPVEVQKTAHHSEAQKPVDSGPVEFKKPESGVQKPDQESIQQESIKEEKSSSLRSESARATSNVIPIPGGQVEAARTIWNDICRPAGLQGWKDITPKRRTQINRLMRERFHTIAAWRDYCHVVAGSSWLITKGGFGIDFAINPNNIAKIVEGNYRDNRSDLRLSGVSAMAQRLGLQTTLRPNFDPTEDDRQGRLT